MRVYAYGVAKNRLQQAAKRLGVPAVVGCGDATRVLKDGREVTVSCAEGDTGFVYRGKRLPSLQGVYLYADYVTGHVWGLRYDDEKKRVTANHEIRRGGFPVFSFGEDDKGEVYLLTSTPTGKGLFWFSPAK